MKLGLLLLLISACGGAVTPEPPTKTEGQTVTYDRGVTSHMSTSKPDEWSLGVECDRPEDTVIYGGCSVGDGGTLKSNWPLPHGWFCAAVATIDDVRFGAWVRCEGREP